MHVYINSAKKYKKRSNKTCKAMLAALWGYTANAYIANMLQQAAGVFTMFTSGVLIC